MAVLVQNNAYSTLASNITDVATTITLAAGTGSRFPAIAGADYFFATVINSSNQLEIVKVTARATDTLTVVRGQDSTTARAYSTGDRIELRVTAALLAAIRDSVAPADGTITSAKLVDASVITAKIADSNVTLAKLVAAVQQSLTPTASVVPFAGVTAPTGWLFCDGSAVSRSTYSALWTAVGTTASPYGLGDGSATFNLPDLRGRTIAGKDISVLGSFANRLTAAINSQTLGANGGAQTHIITVPEMPPHNHIVSAAGNYSGGGNNPVPGSTGDRPSGAAGGGLAHNNVQPTIVLNYIIKT
jgi:microcystin-dependent protein